MPNQARQENILSRYFHQNSPVYAIATIFAVVGASSMALLQSLENPASILMVPKVIAGGLGGFAASCVGYVGVLEAPKLFSDIRSRFSGVEIGDSNPEQQEVEEEVLKANDEESLYYTTSAQDREELAKALKNNSKQRENFLRSGEDIGVGKEAAQKVDDKNQVMTFSPNDSGKASDESDSSKSERFNNAAGVDKERYFDRNTPEASEQKPANSFSVLFEIENVADSNSPRRDVNGARTITPLATLDPNSSKLNV